MVMNSTSNAQQQPAPFWPGAPLCAHPPPLAERARRQDVHPGQGGGVQRRGVRPAEQQEEAAGAGGPQESGADRGHPRAAAELGGGCAEPDPVRHEHSHVRWVLIVFVNINSTISCRDHKLLLQLLLKSSMSYFNYF